MSACAPSDYSKYSDSQYLIFTDFYPGNQLKFSYLKNIIEITFKVSVDYIPSKYFYDLNYLETVTFQKNVGTIRSNVFSSLSTNNYYGTSTPNFYDDHIYNLNPTVHVLKDYSGTFNGLSMIKDLDISSIYKCDVSYSIVNGVATLTFNDMSDCTPSYYSYSNTQHLVFNSFDRNNQLDFSYLPDIKEITFKDYITSIPNRYFYDLHSLQTVTFEKNVITIYSNAFSSLSTIYYYGYSEPTFKDNHIYYLHPTVYVREDYKHEFNGLPLNKELGDSPACNNSFSYINGVATLTFYDMEDCKPINYRDHSSAQHLIFNDFDTSTELDFSYLPNVRQITFTVYISNIPKNYF